MATTAPRQMDGTGDSRSAVLAFLRGRTFIMRNSLHPLSRLAPTAIFLPSPDRCRRESNSSLRVTGACLPYHQYSLNDLSLVFRKLKPMRLRAGRWRKPAKSGDVKTTGRPKVRRCQALSGSVS
ncbi:hypothetical protein RRG08_035897 [Elysia crispata]|uniref:Uncharacterized protein n=1 Tax=Elysia crispata TaxID=231223 RepID=A0AAE1DR28_9GAST|nr:hypothetical protein RRG08_035897 [Elysia crispata]